MPITRSTTLVDALRASDTVLEVLKKHGLDCANCKGAAQDTIEKAAINNGLDPDAFVKEMNAKAGKAKAK